MSSEDKELMARISHLAGRINRHKNQQAGLITRTGYTSGWKRGGSHPYRGAHGARPVHRNRTLVLNGTPSQETPGEPDSGTASDTSNSSWVTKSGRNLQLINSSVYEKDGQARTKAMARNQAFQQAPSDEQERIRLVNHLTQVNRRGATGRQPRHPSRYEVTIEGIRFAVTKNGSKLVKIPDPNNSTAPTPKTAMVGGVKFHRSKNGNLYRHGIIKAHQQFGAVKVDEPCRNFSLTGSCLKGPQCRFVHDPDKVAICKDFLLQGECFEGDSCDLSHDPSPERTPACMHFARDSCTKSDCRYAHIKVSPGAPVCRSFGIYGYCNKGADCTDRHAFECPDFSNTGVCKNKGCKLPHRERASSLRKVKDSNMDVEMEDVNSDEDDVDSDEVDEFIGPDETDDTDYVGRDYIAL